MDSLYPRPSRARIRWPKLRPVVRHLHLPLGLVCRLLPRRHLVAQRAGSGLHPEGRHVRPPCISQLQTLAEGQVQRLRGRLRHRMLPLRQCPGRSQRRFGTSAPIIADEPHPWASASAAFSRQARLRPAPRSSTIMSCVGGDRPSCCMGFQVVSANA